MVSHFKPSRSQRRPCVMEAKTNDGPSCLISGFVPGGRGDAARAAATSSLRDVVVPKGSGGDDGG